MGSMGGMYGSSLGGYGRGMYGGYGGGMYGGMGSMYGGMYGGMGGMGMYGMGGGSSYADSMFRMTQMLEMNSVMLDQLQEHVSMTYNRLRDVVTWVWALKDVFLRREDPGVAECRFESEEARQEALQRVRRRLRVLLVLLGLFTVLALRDSWRQRRSLEADSAWLRATEGLLPAAGLGGAASSPGVGAASSLAGPPHGSRAGGLMM